MQHVSGQAGFENDIDHEQTAHLRMQGIVGVSLDQLAKKWHSTIQCEKKDETKKRETWQAAKGAQYVEEIAKDVEYQAAQTHE